MTAPQPGGRGASRHHVGTRTAAIVRELSAEQRRQRLPARRVVELMGGGWSVRTLYSIQEGLLAPTSEFLLVWAAALGRPLILAPLPDGAS